MVGSIETRELCLCVRQALGFFQPLGQSFCDFGLIRFRGFRFKANRVRKLGIRDYVFDNRMFSRSS